MQYMLLIYSNEAQDAANMKTMSPEQQQAMMGEWYAYTNALKQAECYVAGDALQPTGAATTVRVRTGERMITDGPFAETKEQLGGYYLINADNLDAALEWAAKCPGSRNGSIEVRPIMVFE